MQSHEAAHVVKTWRSIDRFFIMTSESAQASHSNLLKVVRTSGRFATYASSLIALPAGAPFCELITRPVDDVSYDTLQISKHKHVRLDSDLLYLNHSCDPSLELDTEIMLVRVARKKPLKVGRLISSNRLAYLLLSMFQSPFTASKNWPLQT